MCVCVSVCYLVILEIPLGVLKSLHLKLCKVCLLESPRNTLKTFQTNAERVILVDQCQPGPRIIYRGQWRLKEVDSRCNSFSALITSIKKSSNVWDSSTS